MPSATRALSDQLELEVGHYYLVQSMDQEGDCLLCGWPLLVGDKAFLGYDEEVYCSRRCCMELTT